MGQHSYLDTNNHITTRHRPKQFPGPGRANKTRHTALAAPCDRGTDDELALMTTSTDAAVTGAVVTYRLGLGMAMGRRTTLPGARGHPAPVCAVVLMESDISAPY